MNIRLLPSLLIGLSVLACLPILFTSILSGSSDAGVVKGVAPPLQQDHTTIKASIPNSSHIAPTKEEQRNNGEQKAKPYDDPFPAISAVESLRGEASAALKRLETNGVFETRVTTKESVLAGGFPSNWQSCSLYKILNDKLHQQQRIQAESSIDLNIVIMGGSPSSYGLDICLTDRKNPLSGRYSNLLQRDLEEGSPPHDPSWNFQVINMAQGYTNSATNGLVLDSLVDPTTADILIAEFSLNDSADNKEMHVRALTFWLRRVQSLFALVNKPPPPILLLSLWDHGIQYKSNSDLAKYGIDQKTPIKDQLEVILDKYNSRQGWDIQIVDVGAAVNKTMLANNTNNKQFLLSPDWIHPSCSAMKLISNMIQHALFSNLANCNAIDTSQGEQQASRQHQELPLMHPTHNSSALVQKPGLSSLYSLLMQDDVRLASLSGWLPNAGVSKMRVGADSLKRNEAYLLVHSPEKVEATRADRKRGYNIPKCTTTKEKELEFVLLEPNLQWIGLSYSRSTDDIMSEGKPMDDDTKILINGVRVQTTVAQVGGWFSNWIRIGDYLDDASSQPQTYVLSFCKYEAERQVLLHHIVGIMHPM